jgi:hypothetical protein
MRDSWHHVKVYCMDTKNYHHEFDDHVTVHRVKFLILKSTRCTNFSNLFLE